MQERSVLEIVKSTKSSLTIPEARGTVRLFNAFFKQKKGYPRFVESGKWKMYKKIIFTEYNRIINGSYMSEVAKIRKYSSPVAFLRHKCKNVHKLKLHGLTPQEVEYYKEIGGVTDVDELFRRNRDKIDGKIKFILKQWKTADDSLEEKVQNVIHHKRKEVFQPMDVDLCRALLLEKPTCGSVEHAHPAARSFFEWLVRNSKQIFSDLSDKNKLLKQLCKVKNVNEEWQLFIFHWKLWMIFLEQNVDAVWTEACIYLYSKALECQS